MSYQKQSRHRLRFEKLERRIVLDAAAISLVGQSTYGWVTFNDFGFAGGTLDTSNPPEGWPTAAFADFTNDGVTDVLVRDGGEWQLHVNDGKSLFETPWSSGVATASSNENGEPSNRQTLPAEATLVDVADFNGDVRSDVAMYDESTGQIWIGVGTDTHVEDQLWGTLPSGVPQDRIFVGDFSGDGSNDVLVGVDGGRWRLAGGTPAGSGFTIGDWGSFPDYAWDHVLAGDFNGDNIDDIAAIAPDNTWWVWNGGSSGFGPAEYRGHWKMGDNWHDVAVADFNNDGRDDLIGRTEQDELFVGTSKSDEAEDRFHTWRWATGWVHRANWSSISHVDFNEDGLIDQVGHAADGTWWYAENQGVNFRNRYITSTQSFAEVSNWYVLPNFAREEPISVSSFVAVEEDTSEAPTDNAEIATPSTGIAQLPSSSPFIDSQPHDDLITVTLDEENQLVLLGPEINLLGVDVKSAGGFLTPVEGSSVPFDFFLSNNASQVTFGNLGRLQLLENNRLVLPVKWDSSAGQDDLTVQWGGQISRDARGPQGQGQAFLDDELVAKIDPSFVADDVEAEPVATVTVLSDENLSLHRPTVTLEDNLLVLNGIENELILIEVRSLGGHLTPIPGDLTPPFELIVSNTSHRIVLANLDDGLTPTVAGRISLPVQWNRDAGELDLVVNVSERPSIRLPLG